MKKALLAGVTAVALSFAGAAQAGLSIGGGESAGVIPGSSTSNAALIAGGLGFGTGGVLGGYYAGDISVTAPGVLTFTLLGFEAGANNTFNYTGTGGGTLSTTAIADPDRNIFNVAGLASFSRTVNSTGLIPFNFATDLVEGAPPANPAPVVNGSNGAPAANVMNFFATFNTTSATAGAGGLTGTTVYLFLDDTGTSGGLGSNGDDDNHDDMVIKITWAPIPVPEPATLALFGAGLLGLGVAARRRRKV